MISKPSSTTPVADSRERLTGAASPTNTCLSNRDCLIEVITEGYVTTP